MYHCICICGYLMNFYKLEGIIPLTDWWNIKSPALYIHFLNTFIAPENGYCPAGL